jgi:hypothetical protein
MPGLENDLRPVASWFERATFRFQNTPARFFHSRALTFGVRHEPRRGFQFSIDRGGSTSRGLYSFPSSPLMGALGVRFLTPSLLRARETEILLTPSSTASARVDLLAFFGSSKATATRSPGLKYTAPTQSHALQWSRTPHMEYCSNGPVAGFGLLGPGKAAPRSKKRRMVELWSVARV